MIVALLTDFGTRDHFVAAVKGTILSIARDATIADISHEVEPQNIAEAAFTLGCCYQDFPKGTIFLAVVDPGVGSSRRPVAVRAAERLFVCPDNGMLSFVLDDAGEYSACELTNREFLSNTISTTFHGRDVFAHAAGHLANGIEMTSLGPPATDLITLKTAVIERKGGVIHGSVIHIDRFGNLITDLRVGDLPKRFSLEINGVKAQRLRSFYSEAEASELFAIIGSTGRVEISVNGGSAKLATKAIVGQPITVVNTLPAE